MKKVIRASEEPVVVYVEHPEDASKCYHCHKEVPSEYEQQAYHQICQSAEREGKDSKAWSGSWVIASKYALEWTYWKKPTDLTKYIQVQDETKYCEIVCWECIIAALMGTEDTAKTPELGRILAVGDIVQNTKDVADGSEDRVVVLRVWMDTGTFCGLVGEDSDVYNLSDPWVLTGDTDIENAEKYQDYADSYEID